MNCTTCRAPLHKQSLALGHAQCGRCRANQRTLLAYHAKGGYGSLAGQRRLGEHVGHVVASYLVRA